MLGLTWPHRSEVCSLARLSCWLFLRLVLRLRNRSLEANDRNNLTQASHLEGVKNEKSKREICWSELIESRQWLYFWGVNNVLLRSENESHFFVGLAVNIFQARDDCLVNQMARHFLFKPNQPASAHSDTGYWSSENCRGIKASCIVFGKITHCPLIDNTVPLEFPRQSISHQLWGTFESRCLMFGLRNLGYAWSWYLSMKSKLNDTHIAYQANTAGTTERTASMYKTTDITADLSVWNT